MIKKIFTFYEKSTDRWRENRVFFTEKNRFKSKKWVHTRYKFDLQVEYKNPGLDVHTSKTRKPKFQSPPGRNEKASNFGSILV
jgi:hypothetical protein